MAKRRRFAICVRNRGYKAALEVRKIYHVFEDAQAEARGLLRVIDESGEDYLYPEAFFVPVEVPREAVKVFSRKTA